MIEPYQAEDHQYSPTIREKMTDIGISFVSHHPRRQGGAVRTEEPHNELIKFGDPDQLPFLVDRHRGVTISKSETIVEYLRDHYPAQRDRNEVSDSSLGPVANEQFTAGELPDHVGEPLKRHEAYRTKFKNTSRMICPVR